MKRALCSRPAARACAVAALFALPAALRAQRLSPPANADAGQVKLASTSLPPTGVLAKRPWWRVVWDDPAPFGRQDDSDAAAVDLLRAWWVGPQPQAAGEILDVNSGGYTVPAAGDTYATVHVGVASSGTVTQSAGTLTVSKELDLGYTAGLTGNYNLNGGTLAVNALYVGGDGSGAFMQTGGTVAATGEVDLGATSVTTNANNYSISAGALTTPLLVIGDQSAATFTQGGSSTVATSSGIFTGFQFGGNANAVYQLNGGTLTVAGVTSPIVPGTGTFNFNGGTLQASASDNPGTTPSNTFFLTGLGAANVQAGGAKIDTQNFNVTVAQPLLHTSGTTTDSLTKLGTGTLTLTGTNTYSGGTTVSAGRLTAANNGNAIPAGTVAIGSGATVELNVAAATATILQAGGTTFTGSGNLVKTGAGTFAFGGNGGNVTVSLGSGALVDVQAGVLRGSSSNQGFFTNNLSGLNVASGATFNGVEGTPQFDALTGAGSVVGGYQSTRTTTLGVNNDGGTFTGTIGDNGSQGGVLALTKAGTGVQILTGANTYTGATTINAGTLQLGNGGTTGTLSISSAITTNDTLTFNRSNAVTQGTDFSGAAITGTGGITQSGAGAGTLTLNATNTYAGTTTVNTGVLAVNNNATTMPGRLANTSAIVVNAGGTLLLSGSTLIADRLNNAATMTISGGGKFSTGALSEGTAPTAGGIGGAAGIGALTLTATTSALRATVDFGSTKNGSALVFSNLVASSKGAFVSILDFTGSAGVDSGALTNDRLLFASDPGFTTADLSNWQFTNDAGGAFATGGVEIAYNGYFEVVPVPEPATSLAGALLVGAAGLTLRRRRARA